MLQSLKMSTKLHGRKCRYVNDTHVMFTFFLPSSQAKSHAPFRQEYIQGRLHLKERNSIKNITDIKKNQAGE